MSAHGCVLTAGREHGKPSIFVAVCACGSWLAEFDYPVSLDEVTALYADHMNSTARSMN